MPVVKMMKISAVLLAAGASKRFGRENKLLQKISGDSILQKSCQLLRQFEFHEFIIVTTAPGETICTLMNPTKIAVNRDAAGGLASSIKCGISALAADWQGLLIHLADKPFVQVETIAVILREFERCRGKNICLPLYRGKPGHPVIFPKFMLPELLALKGDQGGKKLLRQGKFPARQIAVDDAFILQDINTKNDWIFHQEREKRNAN